MILSCELEQCSGLVGLLPGYRDVLGKQFTFASKSVQMACKGEDDHDDNIQVEWGISCGKTEPNGSNATAHTVTAASKKNAVAVFQDQHTRHAKSVQKQIIYAIWYAAGTLLWP